VYVVLVVDLLDVDFRLYVLRVLRGVFAARIWFEPAYDVHLLLDDFKRHPKLFGDLGEAELLQAIEITRYQTRRQSVSASHLLKLYKQTLFAFERSDSDGVEELHGAAGLLDGLDRPSAHFGYLFESRVEIAVLIEIAYDGFGNFARLAV